MSHHCHAEGCTRVVAPRMFACVPHWRAVPKWLQTLLWATYVPGQEDTKEVTRIYLLVQARCRVALCIHDQRDYAVPMGEIRQLAATSRATALHEAIKDLADDPALAMLDAGLPKLVEAHVNRKRAAS